MFRYLAFIWNNQRSSSAAIARDLSQQLVHDSSTWTTVLRQSGVLLFCTGARDAGLSFQILPNRRGAIVGTIYGRHSTPADPTPDLRAKLSSDETEELLRAEGRKLASDFWGNYVAFLANADSHRWIIKDPAGNLPCYRTRVADVHVFFSHVEDCCELLPIRFTINWSFVRSRAMRGMMDTADAPLNEISSVLRGECVHITHESEIANQVRTFHWTPFKFSGSDDVIENRDTALNVVRGSVLSATHTMVSGHETVLHQLSGGLDSSIILGCLNAAPNLSNIIAYTRYNPNGLSDERRWARIASKGSSRCQHLEIPIEPSKISFSAMPRLARSVEPGLVLVHSQKGHVERELARQYGASTSFGGDGGDSGFCSDSVAFAIDDFLRRHWVRPGLFRLATQIAARQDSTVWRVLGRSVRRKILGSKMADQKKVLTAGSKLINDSLAEDVLKSARFPHPWFSGCKEIPWATIWRLGMLTVGPQFYDLSCHPAVMTPEPIAPLYAQTVIETLLRIPSFVHFDQGRDRGLARQAFAGMVPDVILRRQWKDRAPSMFTEIVQNNLYFIREALLDGPLVSERILNRAALESALGKEPTKSQVLNGEIMHHLDLALWIEQWRTRSSNLAAA